jgi:hypothetical protein
MLFKNLAKIKAINRDIVAFCVWERFFAAPLFLDGSDTNIKRTRRERCFYAMLRGAWMIEL